VALSSEKYNPDPCYVPPIHHTTKNTIVWPPGHRPIWTDPGPKKCSMPAGIDAGLCVRTHKLRSNRQGGDIRCLPSFLLIGVQKAGTRELRNWLHIHPELTGHFAELQYLNQAGCTAESKHRAEPHESKAQTRTICKSGKGRHVDSDLTYFWRGYLDRFPVCMDKKCLNSNTTRHTKYSFEKSPSYIAMRLPQIERLKKIMPSLRFLAILREPVSRLYSWYNMACVSFNNTADQTGGARGFAEIVDGPYAGEIWALRKESEKILGLNSPEKNSKYKWKPSPCSAKNFDRFIIQTLNTTSNNLRESVPILQNSSLAARATSYRPLAIGFYASQLANWLTVYPTAQLHVVTMNELLGDSAKTMAGIESFLGVSHFPYSEHFGTSRTGTTVLRGAHSKLDRAYKANVEPMTPSTADLLERFYAPHHAKLEDVLGRKITYVWPTKRI